MGAYHKSTFVSLAGKTYTVSIYDKTLTQDHTLTLAPESVNLTLDAGDNKYAPIRSLAATISIVSSEDLSTVYSELWDCPVTIECDGKYVFRGFVVPAQWSQSSILYNDCFTIEAQDLLGKLKTLKYEMIGTDGLCNIYTIQQLADACAQAIGLTGATISATYGSINLANCTVSDDAFLPIDHTKGNSDKDWKTYSDILEAICQWMGASAYIEQGVTVGSNGSLIIEQCDNVSRYFASTASTPASDLRSSDVKLAIEPAVSRIVLSPKLGEFTPVQDILDEENYTPSSLLQYNTEDEHNVIYRKSLVSKCIDQSDAIVESASSDSDKPSILDAKSAIVGEWSVKDICSHATPGTGQIDIEAEVFCKYSLNGYPLDWQPSLSSEVYFALYFGDKRGLCTSIDYDSEHNGFYKVKYSFVDVGASRLRLRMVKMSSSNASIFVRSMKVSFPYEDEIDDIPIDINSDFTNEMSIDMTLLANSFRYAGFVGGFTQSAYSPIVPMIAGQYSVCRRRYTATFEYDDFDILAKINFRGKKCTIESADIDLREDTVQITMLEDGDPQDYSRKFTVTATPSNATMGTVTGSGSYDIGSNVVVTATPKSGFVFSRWNNGAVGNPYTIYSISRNTDIIAIFSAKDCNILVSANVEGRGTVTGGGSYQYGASVTISATAASGYRFESWNDGDANASRTFTATEDKNLIAVFVPL